ncbi:MAG: hypothetical protein KDA93_17615 [Planctomycetaceae bacterium]|nr:hypothetical protein [Planctomycetaceae bacterium]
MAKKKARRKKPASRVKKAPKARKKSTKGVTSKAAQKKAPAKKRVAKKSSATKTKTVTKRKSTKRLTALGRARVPGTADLDQMFRNDYEARQVFEFLKVRTVKELEEHAPDQIITDLTAPVVRTVERIRKALAVNNRYLAGDQKFAVQFTKQIR